MGVKVYKPVTASRRFMTSSSKEGITSDKPERSLIEALRKKAGRNSFAGFVCGIVAEVINGHIE